MEGLLSTGPTPSSFVLARSTISYCFGVAVMYTHLKVKGHLLYLINHRIVFVYQPLALPVFAKNWIILCQRDLPWLPFIIYFQIFSCMYLNFSFFGSNRPNTSQYELKKTKTEMLKKCLKIQQNKKPYQHCPPPRIHFNI